MTKIGELTEEFSSAFLNVLSRHDDMTVQDFMNVISALTVTIILPATGSAEETRDIAIGLFTRNINTWYRVYTADERRKGGAE